MGRPLEADPALEHFSSVVPPPLRAEQPTFTTHKAAELRKLIIERANRRIEGLALYQPLPEQNNFHMCRSRERLLRGSNRGGKTLPAAVEVARALTGQDPHDKFPKRDGVFFLVGKNLDHVGGVMWKKLAKPGAYKIIRDRITGQWRAYRPWDLEDVARVSQCRPSLPLIPKRFIKDIAWEDKKKGIPKQVTLTTGWIVKCYSSEGKPPNGYDIDLWWFDEEIIDNDWYPEMAARVADRVGRGIWSATPQAGTDALFELHERAEKHSALPVHKRKVEEFVILLKDNPHIGEEEKLDLADSLSSEQDYRVRIEGDFAVNAAKVFPEFDMRVHGVAYRDIPHTWTRFAVVDPGRQICAVLFAAVPPPADKTGCNRVHLYDELYLPDCDADKFGQAMQRACSNQQFHAFVIDRHGSRVTDTGSGRDVETQYMVALKKYKVRSATTGHGFAWGSDDKQGGVLACRSMLRVREDGTPQLAVLHDKLTNFEWEIKRFRNKRDANGNVTDDPVDRGRVHLMACFRYLAMHGPKYHAPRKAVTKTSPALLAIKAKNDRKRSREGSMQTWLGAGTGR